MGLFRYKDAFYTLDLFFVTNLEDGLKPAEYYEKEFYFSLILDYFWVTFLFFMTLVIDSGE